VKHSKAAPSGPTEEIIAIAEYSARAKQPSGIVAPA
jgi:hypothetical protein